MNQYIESRLPLLWILLALLVALTIGTLVRSITLRNAPQDEAKSHWDSLKSWWLLAVLLTAAVLMGRIGVLVLFAVISSLAMWEYVRLVEPRSGNRLVLVTIVTVAILNYVWIAIGWRQLFLVFVPLCAFLLLTLELVLRGKPTGFVRAAARLEWGLLLLVYCVSHAVLFVLPGQTEAVALQMGPFLFLVLVTETNDIAQALLGRRFGKTPITPSLSPHKTWEGLLGGVCVSMVLSLVLAPWLTWMDSPTSLRDVSWASGLSLVAGALIAVSGFLGDLTMSAVKRDAGVKDSGTWLPGQGGVLDRIDSLTISAPVFYYFHVWTASV